MSTPEPTTGIPAEPAGGEQAVSPAPIEVPITEAPTAPVSAETPVESAPEAPPAETAPEVAPVEPTPEPPVVVPDPTVYGEIFLDNGIGIPSNNVDKVNESIEKNPIGWVEITNDPQHKFIHSEHSFVLKVSSSHIVAIKTFS